MTSHARAILACALLAAAATAAVAADEGAGPQPKGNPMQIHYLEVVTPDVDAVCAAWAAAHGLAFGEPDERLGNARTAPMAGGGLVGVRAPLRPDEEPVVRPYVLVDDIEKALAAAVEAGGVVAHPPLEIPGHGKFAIYFVDGRQLGLWQL